MSTLPQHLLPQVGKLVSVVPVGLKEAALDSPTFRATTLHFSDQLEYLERWLDGYAKAASRLVTDVVAMESVVNTFLSYFTNPLNISEAILDHDYTLQAMSRCGESSKDLWVGLVATSRKIESLVSEPIRAFIHEDLRNFKETRRVLEQAQKQYDYLLSRFSSQSKSKEPSSLREDAFQLHEARKAYLKASMDFSVQAPQIRNSLDRLLVRVSFDQWREFRIFHNNNNASFAKWGHEMDRIKGWIHEMEGSEKSSKRELLSARKQIEESAEIAARPSRELDDYSISTVPYLGSRPMSTLDMTKEARPEKQGWVYLRTLSGKPTRNVWVRRWAFLKNGIFGCLVQGSRTGGVEESERIGVLLCNIRPAFQEERRFCFEVKTKSNSIMLQAETQKELMEWIAAFEAAKRKALENPTSTDISVSGKITVQDPAFAISQPPAPEFAADPADSLTPHTSDEHGSSDRNGSLSLPDPNSSELSPRRSTAVEIESGARDHTSRIIQKLDIHRKSSHLVQPSLSVPGVGGGIASLISPGHNTPGAIESDANRGRSLTNRSLPPSTLAPLTLANPPAPTSMSKAAVMVSNERGIGLGQADKTGGMPSGMMANLWGSSNWGFLNRLESERLPPGSSDDDSTSVQRPSTPMSGSSKKVTSSQGDASDGIAAAKQQKTGPRHRQTVSLDGDSSKVQRAILGIGHEYPSYYPQQLRPQDAQFRLLFPDIKREEPLVMVFRATWNPNDQQEFPGRAYVTTQSVYFYSHYFGLVLTTSVSLESIKEVTAAPGRDCDFLFLHTIPQIGDDTPGRITVKTFLEPLRLLQRRLNFLIQDSTAVEPMELEAMFKALIKMETDVTARTPSLDSWEDVAVSDKNDVGEDNTHPGPRKDLRAPIYIEKDLDLRPKTGGNDAPKFRLPAQPVQYVPQGNLHLAAEKIFEINPKAIFHILFGDKSAVWQLLLHERRARDIKQGPWARNELQHLRRDFHYQIETDDLFGRTQGTTISDYQLIDVLNDHLCYVVTDKRTPWHLPFKSSFRLVSKIVITFIAKGKCKLAIYTKVEWLWSPYGIKNVIDKQATIDLEQDALDLIDLVGDQVRRLGAHSRTKKAITIFGQVGRQKYTSQFSDSDSVLKLEPRKPRTQRTLVQLLLETFISFLESAVSSVMMWTFALFRWGWKTTSANSVILTLLVSSVFINGFYTSRDTYDWWHEKKAESFMDSLGMHSDYVMSKAIYMRDIDEAVANSTIGQASSNMSNCFSTFYQQTVRDQGALTLSELGPRDSVTKSATKRLQQTRERLAMYRHDLLVGLRVVNSIEKEVIQAEWEHWLQQELRRCNQVEILLSKGNESDGIDMQADQAVFADLTDDVKQWYDKYCISCQNEQEQVLKNSRIYDIS